MEQKDVDNALAFAKMKEKRIFEEMEKRGVALNKFTADERKKIRNDKANNMNEEEIDKFVNEMPESKRLRNAWEVYFDEHKKIKEEIARLKKEKRGFQTQKNEFSDMSSEEKLKILVEEIKKRPIPGIEEEEKNINPKIKHGLWFKNFLGHYYKYNKNGVAEKVPVPQDKDYCLGLNIKSSEKCSAFLTILANKNVGFSKEAIKDIVLHDDEFYEDISDKINDLHPKIALAILSKFGFKVNENTEEGTIKIITVSYWLNKLAQKYFGYKNPNEIKEFQALIKGNKKLINFLTLLVQYINSNPGILNRSYQGVATQDDLEDYVNDQFQNDIVNEDAPPNTYTGAYFAVGTENDNDNVMYGGASVALPFMFASSRPLNKSALRNLINNSSAFNAPGLQTGGYDNVYETSTARNIKNSTSKQLINYFNYLIKLANIKNVDIDKNYINDLIEKLQVYENNILSALSTINNYTQTNKSFGSGNAISLVAMENYLDTIVKYSQDSKGLEKQIISKINNVANKINSSEPGRQISYDDIN